MANIGLGSGDEVKVEGKHLSYPSIHTHIPALQSRGVTVHFRDRKPQTLGKISGDNQNGPPDMALAHPFVVEVQDQDNTVLAGVAVRFTVTTVSGTLSVENAETDANGRAQSTLTLDKNLTCKGPLQLFTFESTLILGRNLGTHTVEVTVAEIQQTEVFTATAVAPRVNFPAWTHKFFARLEMEVKSPLVNIPDRYLREDIESGLRKKSGDPITATEMAILTQLSPGEIFTGDLTGLNFATNLKRLELDGSVSNISALSSLTNLRYLDIRSDLVSDISVLSGLTKLKLLRLEGYLEMSLALPERRRRLPNLEWLRLQSNSVSDISPLSGLTNLRVLGFQSNSVSDISPLSGLTNLRSLGFQSNSVSDISPLSRLTNLRVLEIRDTSASDISALSRLTNLIALGLQSNSVSDLSALSGLTNLRVLEIRDTSASDLAVLSGLTKLRRLYLGGNSVSDISVLSRLTNLRVLGIENTSLPNLAPLVGLAKLRHLYLEATSVADLSALSSLTNLKWLELRNNSISDLSVLSSLTELTDLFLEGNPISDLSALSGLTKLTRLSLKGNSISDISALLGLTKLRSPELGGNPLSYRSIHTHIPTLKSRGVWVRFDDRTPTTLLKISGDNPPQQGLPGTTLAGLFVVEVKDQNDATFEGVPVTFTVTAGGGTLSVENAETDANGRAQSTLTLGTDAGTNTVEVTFTVTEGGGTLSVKNAETDANDWTQSTLPFGTDADTNTVAVTATEIEQMQTFTATALT